MGEKEFRAGPIANWSACEGQGQRCGCGIHKVYKDPNLVHEAPFQIFVA